MSKRSANVQRSRESVKEILRKAFRRKFPNDTVDVSDGYQDNIHVLVVSREFDSMTEKQKQQVLWRVVDSAGLTDAEKSLISLVYPLSVAELK